MAEELAEADVALLAEGVDRNTSALPSPQKAGEVALLAEGVDRNSRMPLGLRLLFRSPSSRRAWIEMSPAGSACMI